MSETTIAAPLSSEEIVESHVDRFRLECANDCHLNPALAYFSFESHFSGEIILRGNGGEEVVVHVEFRLADRPPNVVRQAAGLPIPTLVEEPNGRKEVKSMKFARRTEHEPGKEHEKHEHEHDPKKPGQGQPGQPGQQPSQPGQHPQQEPKR